VARRAGEVAAMLGRPDAVGAQETIAHDAYFGPGYGLADDTTREGVRLAAHLEGLILDPVYTGKGMAGLIGLARTGALPPGKATVFVHTGGWPAVFAYRREMADT
jgi:1-aminocyclopropane-1-carboxylate deaminase/D-cysteine desulfhydrase-like pyridoxal-dependent ACC family enzyme